MRINIATLSALFVTAFMSPGAIATADGKNLAGQCPHLISSRTESTTTPGTGANHHLVELRPLPGKNYADPPKATATDADFSRMNKWERLELAKTHGPVIELSCQRKDGQKCFYVEDGDMAMSLLKSSRKYPDVAQTRASSSVPPAVKKIIGGEIFLGDGTPWKNRRETLRDLFSVRHVQAHQQQIRQVMDEFEKRLLEAADTGEELNLLEEMNSLTFDIFLNVYLQKRNEGRLKEAFLSFRRMFRSINEELLAGKANTPSDVRKMMGNRKIVDEVNRELVDERRQLGFPDPSRNLIDRLARSENEDGQPLSLQQILGEMRTIYVASTDTTAWLLTQGVSRLIQNPQSSRSLIREVVGLENMGRDFENPNNFQYSSAFIREVLRMSPPFHTLSLSVDSDISLGDFKIPRGSVIYISPDSLQSDPRTWTDPEVFLPERFLVSGNTQRQRGCNIPFGSGERICLGQSLARMEALLFFTVINRHFEFSCAEACEPEEIRPSFIRSTSRENPFRVKVRFRGGKRLETTYDLLTSIPIGGVDEGTWQFASSYQMPYEIVQPLFDNVYVPMGSEKKPQFDLFLVAKDGDDPMVVLGLEETGYGVRIDRVGHNNTRKALKVFSDFMSVRGINGLYMEIHGVPLVLSSRKGDMKIVPFEYVREIQTGEGVEIRRPTSEEIQQAVSDGLLPDKEEIYNQSYIRIVNENGTTRERKIRVMVGRPYGMEGQ